MPHLTDHDLRQMDETWQNNLSEAAARSVLARALEDLKQARDRLNQNSANSSRPPGSMPYWDKPGSDEDEEAIPPQAASDTKEAAESSPLDSQDTPTGKAPSGRKPGKQRGAQGHGRTQKFVINDVVNRHPTACAACGEPLAADAVGLAYSAWDTIELLPVTAR